jgi:hypothetical protein
MARHEDDDDVMRMMTISKCSEAADDRMVHGDISKPFAPTGSLSHFPAGNPELRIRRASRRSPDVM